MKKTLTVNLNGRVFNIDEDAYQLLDNYLKNLRIYFRNEEGSAEILADFEARIEELLNNRVRLGVEVINIEEVEKVIAQVGNPDEFGTSDNEPAGAASTQAPEESAKKKFYRNPDDKLFAGVCSGIAAYTGWSVIPVRLLAILLFFIPYVGWGAVALAYIILWMIVPEARTAEQKLEMQGKPITVENIGKTVAEGMESVKSSAEKSGCLTTIIDFFVAFIKVCAIGLGCLIAGPVLFALVLVFIVLFSVLFGVGGGLLGSLFAWPDPAFLSVAHPAIATIALALVIGLPVVALIYSLISKIFKLKPVHKGVKWAGIVLWALSLIALPFSGFSADWDKLRSNQFWNTHWNPDHSVKGDGLLAERTVQLSPTTAMEVSGGLNIRLEIESGSTESAVSITGDSNLLDLIDVRVSNGRLRLSNKEDYELRPTTPFVIRLQTADLRTLRTQGASKVELAKPWKGQRLKIKVSGASTFTANELQVDSLNADVSGAAKIVLSGRGSSLSLDASGASKIDAGNYIAASVDADASGASKIVCYPVEYLKAEASGASTILYKSEPKQKRDTASGASKIALE
jgi:phage shock protein PspC (stress-responsive transcriptional regulator)